MIEHGIYDEAENILKTVKPQLQFFFLRHIANANNSLEKSEYVFINDSQREMPQ